MVSVIIPAYKAEKYIAQTIESVINQSFQDWELWVINDGSPDNLENIALDYCNKDPRIHYFKQENAGVSAARNKGYQLAQGNFLAFLDADDIWLPDNLETKIKKFEHDPELGLVHSDAQIINQDSIPTGDINSGKEGYILNDLLRWEETCIPAPSSILIKRELIEKIGGFETKLSTAADMDFFFRAAKYYKIGRVPYPTWQYRIHDTNMHQNIYLMESDVTLAFQLAHKNNLFESEKFRKVCFANMYLILAASWWGHHRNFKKTAQNFTKSIASHPPIIKKIARKIWRKIQNNT